MLTEWAQDRSSSCATYLIPLPKAATGLVAHVAPASVGVMGHGPMAVLPSGRVRLRRLFDDEQPESPDYKPLRLVFLTSSLTSVACDSETTRARSPISFVVVIYESIVSSSSSQIRKPGPPIQPRRNSRIRPHQASREPSSFSLPVRRIRIGFEVLSDDKRWPSPNRPIR